MTLLVVSGVTAGLGSQFWALISLCSSAWLLWITGALCRVVTQGSEGEGEGEGGGEGEGEGKERERVLSELARDVCHARRLPRGPPVRARGSKHARNPQQCPVP